MYVQQWEEHRFFPLIPINNSNSSYRTRLQIQCVNHKLSINASSFYYATFLTPNRLNPVIKRAWERSAICSYGPYIFVINYLCTVFCIYFSCSIVLGNNTTLSECSVKPYMCMYKAYMYLYVSLFAQEIQPWYSVLFILTDNLYFWPCI